MGRVAQSVSPAVNKPSSLTVSDAAVASNNALMANAGSSAAAAISAAVAPISVASSVALDLKPRTSDSLTWVRPPSVSEASSKPPMPLPTGTAPPNGEQPPSGMSLCLDYVKNRIVEEMKKHGDDDQPLPGVTQQQQAAIAAGQKRTSPEAASGQSEQDSLANKKAKLDAQVAEAVAAPNNSNANNPPDSPGSPGEMVIDERPDDGPNKMASSSGHDQSSSGNPSNNSTASSNIEASNKTTMTPVTTAAASNNSNTNASGTSGTTPLALLSSLQILQNMNLCQTMNDLEGCSRIGSLFRFLPGMDSNTSRKAPFTFFDVQLLYYYYYTT